MVRSISLPRTKFLFLGVLSIALAGVRWLPSGSIELLPMVQALWLPIGVTVFLAWVAAAVCIRTKFVRAFTTCLALLISLGVWQAVRPSSTSEVRGSAEQLSVVSINMKQSSGSTSDVAREADLRGADIIVLLECDETAANDLVRQEGMAEYRYRSPAPRKTTLADSVILSRVPLESSGADIGLARPNDLQQPYVRLTLSSGKSVVVVGVHPVPPLPALAGAWAAESADVRAFAEKQERLGDRVILAGDFNATRDHPSFRKVLKGGAEVSKSWGLAATWPSPTPLLSLDHIVARGFECLERGSFRVQGTDHRGLWVKLSVS